MSIEVTLKQRATKGFAIANDGDVKAGLMTYKVPAEDYIIIDHTEVEEAYKGGNVGDLMLDKIVEMAREKNIKIFPQCPYARVRFKRRDDIKDVLKHQL